MGYVSVELTKSQVQELGESIADGFDVEEVDIGNRLRVGDLMKGGRIEVTPMVVLVVFGYTDEDVASIEDLERNIVRRG